LPSLRNEKIALIVFSAYGVGESWKGGTKVVRSTVPRPSHGAEVQGEYGEDGVQHPPSDSTTP